MSINLDHVHQFKTTSASLKTRLNDLNVEIKAKGLDGAAQQSLKALQQDAHALRTEIYAELEGVRQIAKGLAAPSEQVNRLALKLLDLERSTEVVTIDSEKLLHPMAARSTSEQIAGLCDLYSSDVSTAASSTAYATLRAEVPRPKDPLLEKIIATDSQIVQNARAGKAHANEELLKKQGAERQEITLVGDSGHSESFVVWKDRRTTQHLAKDHGNWKLQPFIVDKISSAPAVDPYDWMNCVSTLKSCASVLKNSDRSFCGQDGALVYIAPKSPEALIAAAAHDIHSPCEHYDAKHPIYGLSLHTVHGYLEDQKKFRLSFDLAQDIKGNLSNQLARHSDHPNYAHAKQVLAQKLQNSMEKQYYAEAQPTNLELEWGHIREALQMVPELQKELGVTADGVSQFGEALNRYLDSDAVVTRGVNRESTTAYELKAETRDRKLHPLGVEQRTIGYEIGKITKEMKDKFVLIGDAAVVGDSLDADHASEIAANKKDDLFRNIFRNAIQSHTLTEAVQLLEEHVLHPPGKESVASVEQVQAQPWVRKGLSANVRPSEVKEVLKQSSLLAKDLAEAEQMAKSTYMEAQVYSSECDIAGFGLKKNLLDELQQTDIGQAIRERDALKAQQGDPKRVDRLNGLIGTYNILREAQRLNLPCYIHTG